MILTWAPDVLLEHHAQIRKVYTFPFAPDLHHPYVSSLEETAMTTVD